MTTTFQITDCGGSDKTVSGATRADALRNVYDELVRRNDGDCAGAIADGHIVNHAAYTPTIISLELDPEAFWSMLVEIMLSDDQDVEEIEA